MNALQCVSKDHRASSAPHISSTHKESRCQPGVFDMVQKISYELLEKLQQESGFLTHSVRMYNRIQYSFIKHN